MEEQQQLVGRLRAIVREAIAREASNGEGFRLMEQGEWQAVRVRPSRRHRRMRHIQDISRLARHTGTADGIYGALGANGWAGVSLVQLEALRWALRALAQAMEPGQRRA